MNLSQALAKTPRAKKGPPCGVCALPKSVREEIVKERARPMPTTYPQLAAALKLMGHSVADYTIAEHVRKGHQ